MNEQKLSHVLLLSGALIVSAAVFGGFYYSGQLAGDQNVLSVTGSAKTRVTADQAKLIVSISRIAPLSDLSSGYRGVARDRGLTRDLLKKAGIADADITESPVSMNQMYEQYQTELRYQLNQVITVQSSDIQKITEISKSIPDLTSQGAIVSIQSLEYYYSKLPDLRVSLLTQAVEDAKARAEKIAQGTGQRVGSVQAASSGVVQVLPPNSIDVSDYGSYDTSSIEKDIMVTVKTSFRLN